MWNLASSTLRHSHTLARGPSRQVARRGLRYFYDDSSAEMDIMINEGGLRRYKREAQYWAQTNGASSHLDPDQRLLPLFAEDCGGHGPSVTANPAVNNLVSATMANSTAWDRGVGGSWRINDFQARAPDHFRLIARSIHSASTSARPSRPSVTSGGRKADNGSSSAGQNGKRDAAGSETPSSRPRQQEIHVGAGGQSAGGTDFPGDQPPGVGGPGGGPGGPLPGSATPEPRVRPIPGLGSIVT